MGGSPCDANFTEAAVASKYGWDDVYQGKPVNVAWHWLPGWCARSVGAEVHTVILLI